MGRLAERRVMGKNPTRGCRLAMLGLACALTSGAQDFRVSLEDLVEQGRQWAEENVDEQVLRSLGDVDGKKVQQFLSQLQKQLHANSVVDLAPLQQAAQGVLPLLRQHPETRPYAAWLKSRMDYLEAAESYRASLPAPTVEPGRPLKTQPNPEPVAARLTWQKRLEQQPVPTGAEAMAARLKPVFARQGLPKELVWLAEVESSFDPAARSPVGAAGLYQLMPRTAQGLGLALRPSDERLNPERNAAAAAKYLKYLHGRFKDWPLALAAYNAGEGTVGTLLVKNKARTFDQIAKNLPAETQMYVPRFEATLRKREGLALSRLPAPTG
jgi:membrane-bound lytic murein transglycosylase D